MNTNTQRSNNNPQSVIGAVMFTLFLSIELLGALYYFLVFSGSGQFGTGDLNNLVQATNVQPSDFKNSATTNGTGNVDATGGIQQNSRSVVIGSTESQIEEALLQCKQFSTDCRRSWYEDELESSASLQPFSLDNIEVTVSQFAQFVEKHNYRTDAELRGSSYSVDKPYDDYAIVSTADLNWQNAYSGNSVNYPVVHVSQRDAAAYCDSVQKRLPTEAEWEYVASGHKRLKYPWGQQWDESKLQWGPTDDSEIIRSIASYPPTLLGHYDLAGGVSEWTSTTDDSQNRAFIKGASRFDTNVANARIAVRRLESIEYSGEDVGFRCVKELDRWPELSNK